MDSEFSSKKHFDLLKKVPDFANYMIARFYNFNKATLSDIIGLDRSGLAGNARINWDKDLFAKMFTDVEAVPKGELSKNPSIIKNVEILKTYHDFFDWWVVSYNSIQTISDAQYLLLEDFYKKELFAEYFNFDYYPNLFKKYKGKLLNELSSSFSSNIYFTWSLEFILENKAKLNFKNLCSNSSIRVDWDFLNKLGSIVDWNGISRNENDFWSYDFIKKNEDKLNWIYLSQNRSIPWTLEFMERYENLIDFEQISKNPSVIWNEALINRFYDKVEWENLCQNTGVEFDYSLIKKFEKDIYWGSSSKNFSTKRDGLSSNPRVIWTKELIDDYWDKIVFDVDCINVNGVLCNNSFPWTLQILLDKYDDLFMKKITRSRLGSNINVWNIFRPYINDENVKSIIFDLIWRVIGNNISELSREREMEKIETSRYVNFVLSLSDFEKEVFRSAYGGDIDAYIASQE